jgi:hypothetical protein
VNARILLFAVWCALLGYTSFPLDASTVRLVDLPGRLEAEAPIPAVFGNRDQGLDLEIKDATAQSGALSAELFQISGDLAVPLGTAIPLQNAVTLTGGPSQLLHVSLKFPNIKQRAEILVRLSLIQPAPAPPMQLGELRFEVFPSAITKELTDLLQPGADGTTPVVLFGAGRKLHLFLASVRVSFDDAGLGLPDRFEPNHFYFGEATKTDPLEQTQEMGAARTAIFSPDESLPPGFYTERGPSGVFIRVTLPLLDNLGDDPRAQLALIKIIHLLSS